MADEQADHYPSPAHHPGRDVTLHSLQAIDNKTIVRVSKLTLPEIEELKREIAGIFPAGNLPGLILSGLTSIKGRRLSRKRVDDDITAMFKGIGLLPQGLYSLFIAGPAVVLAAYQGLLTLAGKDVNSAFPEGTWQFYLQFGLREDQGRHTNETIAYHRDRPQQADLVDDVTAWLMTSINTLFDSEVLSAALWTEWRTLRLIRKAAKEAGQADKMPFVTMLRDWQLRRPYDALAGTSYADQRREAFDEFSKRYFDLLDDAAVREIKKQLHALTEQERTAYQQQMSLLACLQPGKYRDERVSVPLWEAKVGLIWNGHVYLFDACARDTDGQPLVYTQHGDYWPLQTDKHGRPLDPNGDPLVTKGGWFYQKYSDGYLDPVAYLAPADPALIKGQVSAILKSGRVPSRSTVDTRLVLAPRTEQERLRTMLPAETQYSLQLLGKTPILLNWDKHDRKLPLGMLRRSARRGIGDHPLTIIRTADSIVFDQSHIFFDGLWGMAIAEVMTNQAISWCSEVVNTDALYIGAPEPLPINGSTPFEATAIAQYHANWTPEVDVESNAVNMTAIHEARHWLKLRGTGFTINDMLLLARIFHAADYRPDKKLAAAIDKFIPELRTAVWDSLNASTGINPSLLIPMDASFVKPNERIFPTTFRNVLPDLLDVYDDAVTSYEDWQAEQDEETWQAFDIHRRDLLSYLRTFGEMLNAIKAITMRGESFNVATIRMLAHLPSSMQHLLDQIPQRVGILNEVVKGEEVFSNVGRVAKGSSLVRFMSAKDDGQSKKLVWGFLTDDTGQMQISLRDFRPHIDPLTESGRSEFAVRLAQDYLDAYVETLNRLAETLSAIALARE